MSFQDLEAGTLPPPPLSQVLAHSVFQINTKVAALRRLGDALGTPKDTPALRGRLRRTRAEVMRLAKTTSEKLKQADSAGNADLRRHGASAASATERMKLTMDFEAALREFQQVQRRIMAAERRETAAAAPYHKPLRYPQLASTPPVYASTPRSVRHDGAGTLAGDHRLAAQTQQQLPAPGTQELAVVSLDGEIAFNEAIVEEREQGIQEVQREIAVIHEIFRDLATLVHDQGAGIDHVVSNIGETAAATSQAEEQLSKAGETQGEADSSMKCLLLVVLGLVLFIVVVVLVE